MTLSQVNLDSNVGNIQELKSWPEFHNAVAAGLRLSPLQVYLIYHMVNPIVNHVHSFIFFLSFFF